MAPGKYDKNALIETLNEHAFEAVDVGGDVIEISVPPNRFSDAASHRGIALEAAALLQVPFRDPLKSKMSYGAKGQGIFRVNIKEKKLCNRYLAAYVTNVKVGASPEWIKEIIESAGIRSINAVVDIMNYVMLEIGQPLHAFDAEKVSGGIVVRRAMARESIETLDNQKISLDTSMLVISDTKRALAIAGVKGGKFSEVTPATKSLLIEAANFDGAAIYAAARALNLHTDASARFSHQLSPELAWQGMQRALDLLREVLGAKIYQPIDLYGKKQPRKIIPLRLEKLNAIIGVPIKEPEVIKLLAPLGFSKRGKFLEVPALRLDVADIEDIAEEVIRLRGYGALPAQAPAVALNPAFEAETVLLKDRVRNYLAGIGCTEVYNYSLVSRDAVGLAPPVMFGGNGGAPAELANPMSKQYAALRDSLASGLVANLKSNSRFFDEVRIFEIGSVFRNGKNTVDEQIALGIAVAAKNAVLELKGVAEVLFEKLGVTDYFFPDLNYPNSLLKSQEALRIETSDHQVVGYLGSVSGVKGAVLELNLGKLLTIVDEEREFEPLSKFPAIVRDLSILVSDSVRVGEILSLIQRVSSKLVEDVDLLDWYQDEKLGDNKKSLTFRVVFRAADRTLTDADADKEMAIINQILIDKFDVELR